MICPSCGAEVASSKFCENCGSPLLAALDQATQPVEQQTQPVVQSTSPMGQATQPVAQATQPVTQPTEPMSGAESADVPGNQAWQAQPQQVYQTAQTLQMPPQATSAGGGYVPPAGGQQPSYRPAAPYQAPPSGNLAPNAAFVLVIVGLVLSVLFVTFIPGLVCSIIGLVLNAGYNKKGLVNPRKTPTTVIGIVGIVIAILCAVVTIIMGVLTAQVLNELENQGIDITSDSVEVTTDSSGHINITVNDSSDSSASNDASSSSVSPGRSADSSSASASPSSIYDQSKYHDSAYNPTLYSVLELTGSEFSDMLEYFNFYWDDDIEGWAASDGSQFIAIDSQGELTKSKIKDLPKGAAGKPILLALTVEGYSTPSAALSELSADIVVDETSNNGNGEFAIVHGSSPNTKYLVAITPGMTDEQVILVFTEESISSGLFGDLIGVDAGKSLDEVWETVTASATANGSI